MNYDTESLSTTKIMNTLCFGSTNIAFLEIRDLLGTGEKRILNWNGPRFNINWIGLAIIVNERRVGQTTIYTYTVHTVIIIGIYTVWPCASRIFWPLLPCTWTCSECKTTKLIPVRQKHLPEQFSQVNYIWLIAGCSFLSTTGQVGKRCVPHDSVMSFTGVLIGQFDDPEDFNSYLLELD